MYDYAFRGRGISDKLKHDYIKQGGQEMVREYPALVKTNARDLSKNSGNPAFAHPNLCPDMDSLL